MYELLIVRLAYVDVLFPVLVVAYNQVPDLILCEKVHDTTAYLMESIFNVSFSFLIHIPYSFCCAFYALLVFDALQSR